MLTFDVIVIISIILEHVIAIVFISCQIIGRIMSTRESDLAHNSQKLSLDSCFSTVLPGGIHRMGNVARCVIEI